MKKSFLPILLLLFLGFSVSAQKSVMLNIEHMFNGESVEYDVMKDAGNGSYMLDWVSYYLSDFSLIQSDQTEFNIENSYALIKMDEEGYYEIGKANVEDVVGLKFHIGVPESVNHNDPASWPEYHPLNYQIPSMHWGWAGGYIFFVFNGRYDADHSANPVELFDMEAIGDPLYRDYEMDLTTGVEITENEIWINIQADYYKLTDGINMPYSNHGDDPILAKMMDNIADLSMFTESVVSSDKDLTISDLGVTCFPNPSEGNFILTMHGNNEMENATISIFNSLGQMEKKIDFSPGQRQLALNIENAGSYYIIINNGDRIIDRQKIIVL